MSAGLISYSHGNSDCGPSKRPVAGWNNFGRIRDFARNSIQHASLPLPKTYTDAESYDTLIESTECRLWSAAWNQQISPEAETFLEESACLGYTEDQTLAVMFVSKFDVRVARERLLKFRNIYIPILSPADQQIFHELLASSLGKKFSSYRTSGLPHVPVKDMVNFYYYQKQLAKRKNATNTTLGRQALEMARERLTPDYLKELRFSGSIRNSEISFSCNGCFRRGGDIFRAGSDILFCPACYTFIQRHKRLPNVIPVEPVTLPYSTPEGLAERAGARGQENCTILAHSNGVQLMREHRRLAQKLSKVRRLTPSACDRVFLMNQIDAVLSQENRASFITSTAEIITLE